jgi:lipid-A-disaccharide synthase-like uncharacterized protein
VLEQIAAFLGAENMYELAWIGLGFFAQFMFMMRFMVQWIASERASESIVPVGFWYFSIFGGLLMLAYAIHREDPVFIAGQALGMVIYLRNLYFILFPHGKRNGVDGPDA